MASLMKSTLNVMSAIADVQDKRAEEYRLQLSLEDLLKQPNVGDILISCTALEIYVVSIRWINPSTNQIHKYATFGKTVFAAIDRLKDEFPSQYAQTL